MHDVEEILRVADAVEPLGLEALDEAVGGARVVLLGEQSHGDGAAFAAKARMVEHLHRKHGFGVLAFEADFYALERAWPRARSAADVAALRRHVYGFWREGPIEPLWDLVRERLGSEQPLVVTGIDTRHSGAYPKAEVATGLEAHLAERDIRPGPGWPRFRKLLVDMLEREYGHRVDAGDRMHFMEQLMQLGEQLTGADEESAFWRQELRNLSWTARNAWGFEGRDEGMGRNLAWLATERYPHEKIVVWAHNFHLVRSAAALDANHPPYAREREKYPGAPLGEVAARELGNAVRSIAFVAGRGWHTPNAWSGDVVTRAEIVPPPTGSLEGALLARDLVSGYLDLRHLDDRFTMNGIEHGVPVTAPWDRIFDGVVYLRDMIGLSEPALPSGADPNPEPGRGVET